MTDGHPVPEHFALGYEQGLKCRYFVTFEVEFAYRIQRLFTIDRTPGALQDQESFKSN